MLANVNPLVPGSNPGEPNRESSHVGPQPIL